MKRILLLLLYPCAGVAQNGVLLKFSPLALVDEVSFPTIQAGAEFRISNKLSLYNEAGIRYRGSVYDDTDSSFVKAGGYKIKTELRFYFNNQDVFRFTGKYLAAAVFYTADRHNTAVEWHMKDSSTYYADVFGVHKKVAGINLLYGIQIPLSDKWLLDAYIGPGIRYRSITAVNKEYDKAIHGLRRPVDINIPFIRSEIDADSKNNFTGNLSAGVRICYKLASRFCMGGIPANKLNVMLF